MERRNFLRRSAEVGASVFCVGTGLSLLSFSISHARPKDSMALRPPGSIAEDFFLEKCIRCHRCVDVCPSQAIQIRGPSGPVETHTPFIIPSEHACILCLRCSQVCPSGALKPVATKEEVKIGVARIDKRLCVAHNGSGFCGACHTACPIKNKAITIDYRTRPTMHEDDCTGCGQCEAVCPSDGVKAIRVFPLEGVA